MNDDFSRLALSVTHPDGSVKRWGGDEPDAADVPGDLEFGTSIPGGDKDLRCSLLRDVRTVRTDEGLLYNVRVYGAGNRTAWNGRLVQFPRENLQVNPGAVGHAAHLKDDTAWSEIYICRDISRFRAPSLSRQAGLVGGGYGERGFQIRQDTTSGTPGIETGWVGNWDTKPISEAWYDAGPGNLIGRLRASWARVGSAVNDADANWLWSAWLSTGDDTNAGGDNTGSISLPGPGTVEVVATAARRFAMLLLAYDAAGAAGTDGQAYPIHWTNVRMIGTHGLTIRGSTPEEEGFYGDDLIADVVSRAAPLLKVTRGSGGIEANPSFVVPHCAFYEPTSAEEALMLINAYYLWEWGVYDDRRFFWREPSSDRLTWEARLSDGAQYVDETATAETLVNGVVVHYTDGAGGQHVVGPPAEHWDRGRARADATDPLLVDTNPLNPVNLAGIPRKWGRLEIEFPTTVAGAISLGHVWLLEHALTQRRGSITLTGFARHPDEGIVPPWRMRAGDWLKVSDLPGDVPRRIIDTGYSHGSRQVRASVGSTDFKLDAILERIGVQMVGVVT